MRIKRTGWRGAAEGLLLSVLPVVVVWQGFAARGWTGGWLTITVRSLPSLSAFVVLHHFGYREFRNRKIVQTLFECGVVSANP